MDQSKPSIKETPIRERWILDNIQDGEVMLLLLTLTFSLWLFKWAVSLEVNNG